MHWLNVEAFLPKNLYASLRSNSCLKKLVQLAGTYYRKPAYMLRLYLPKEELMQMKKACREVDLHVNIDGIPHQ